tara:strand:+ start:5036 stop:6700 length:1665 start_codon:yes stop_codon:yes gene_type:complete
MKKIILVFLLGLLVWGCAQIVPLSGGEKDTIPPSITISAPKNFSTHYTGNRIVLEFDEYITTKNLKQNVIVSPPLKNTPEYITKSKKVIMVLHDTLLPNTTYNINFGEGIVDFTEGNPLDSNVFVFSTGDYVDSLFVEGNIKDAFSLQPIGGVMVMAYHPLEDSVPRTHRPDYFTLTDAQGNFKIDYMKEGEYKFFALEDKNSNYLFDLPNERIAFVDSTFNPLSSDSISAMFFTEDHEKQYIKSKKAEFFGKMTIVFNRDLESYSPNSPGIFEPLRGVKWDPSTMIQEYLAADSMFLWFPKGYNDTLKLVAVDDTMIIDTLKMRLPSKEDFVKDVEKERTTFDLLVKPDIDGKTHHYFEPLTFTTNHPISSYTYDSIVFVENDDTLTLEDITLKQANTPEEQELNSMRTKLFNYKWKKDTKYQITLLPGAFNDIFGLTNDTIAIRFNTKKMEDYGNLVLQIESEQNIPFIFQLLDKQQKKILDEQTFTGNHTIQYPLMDPDEYSFRMIYDQNGNGKWDTGEYATHRQPEKVVYYPELVQVRANWDMELKWHLK